MYDYQHYLQISYKINYIPGFNWWKRQYKYNSSFQNVNLSLAADDNLIFMLSKQV